MPVNIQQITSEVDVIAGELPFTEAQINALVQIILQRLAQQQQVKQAEQEATAIRDKALPPLKITG